MSGIRIAVIGAGHLGRIHAEKLRRIPGATLAAVVDPLASARDSAASAHGVPVYADVRECLDQFDAAVLSAPTPLHFPIALPLLTAGKHLLIEKPLASKGVLASELAATARRRGVIVQVGHVERFNPAVVAAWHGLGAPKYIEATRASGFSGRSVDTGVVLDLMIHDIDLILAMVRSPVVRAQALGLSLLGEPEDVAQARLEFASGCVANLSASRVSMEPTRRMQVWSTTGHTTIDFAARTATRVTPSAAVRSKSVNAARLQRPELLALRERLHTDHLKAESLTVAPADAIEAELTEFVSAIEERRDPRVTIEDGRNAMLAAEMILASIESHAWTADADGPLGPRLTPPPRIIPAPHFDYRGAARRAESRKEAG